MADKNCLEKKAVVIRQLHKKVLYSIYNGDEVVEEIVTSRNVQNNYLY